MSIPALTVCLPCTQVTVSLKLKVKSVPFFRKRSSKLTLGELGTLNEKRGMMPSGLLCGYHCPAVKPMADRSTVESGLPVVGTSWIGVYVSLYGVQPS